LQDAFAAFPWEVLEVFSGPPTVGFTWRHWGTFTGSFKDNRGKGELIEMFGFATAKVSYKLGRLCRKHPPLRSHKRTGMPFLQWLISSDFALPDESLTSRSLQQLSQLA